MRKICLLLGITLLLQGCFSYKKAEINPKTMAIGQMYKIERNHKTSKVMYTGNADSAIVVLKNGKEERIALKDINSVRKRKFSIVKTVAVPVAVLVGFTTLFILTYNGPETQAN